MSRISQILFLIVAGCSSTTESANNGKIYRYLKARVEESNSLYTSGRYQEAAELRERLLEEHPSHTFINNPEFFARIGDCWRRDAELLNSIEDRKRREASYNRALKWYETAVEKFERDLDYFYNRLKNSKVKDEQRECEKIIMERIRPRLAEIHTYIGGIYIKQERYRKAVVVLKKALSADSLNARAHYLIGCALDAIGGHDEQVYKSFEGFLQLIENMPKEELIERGITERDIEYAEKRLAEFRKDGLIR